MKKILIRFVAATLLFGGLTVATNVHAQRGPGGGGEDRAARFQQMMMERMRERFDVKDDEEWKLISQRMTKVFELRRSGRGGFGGGRSFGPPRGGRDGGRGGEGEGERRARPERDGDGERREGDRERGGRDRGREPGGSSNPAVAELEKALDSDASAKEIKSKLAALRASRKADAAKLKKAQAELREVLTSKQEARAVLMGLLD